MKKKRNENIKKIYLYTAGKAGKQSGKHIWAKTAIIDKYIYQEKSRWPDCSKSCFFEWLSSEKAYTKGKILDN